MVKKIILLLSLLPLSEALLAGKSADIIQLCNSAFTAYQNRELQKALELYNRALDLQPNNCRILFNTGHIYALLGNKNQAVTRYNQSIAADPQYTKARRFLADEHAQKQQYELAIQQYLEITTDEPQDITSWYNCAHMLKTIGKYAEAIPFYKKTIDLAPNHERAQFGLAKALLATGDFEKGWKQFEWRHHNYKNEPNKNRFLELKPENLINKTVLLRAEFGLGDTIFFIRYAKQLKKIGAKKLIVETPAPLIPLFSLCSYIDEVVQKGTVPTNVDFTIPILSLPLLFNTRLRPSHKTMENKSHNKQGFAGQALETIPNTTPYLQADPDLSLQWEKKLRTINPHNHVLNVGLCWHASPDTFLEQNRYTKRSIPLELFKSIAQLPNIKLYSLQKQDGIDQLTDETKKFIHCFDNDFDESNGRFMDTAALVQQLDLVISVDTSIAHLAGALATPVWILLPKSAEWRWQLDKKETPWYPTARLFRQPEYENWKSVIETIQNLLAELR